MLVKRVEVLRYYACDGTVFGEESKCYNYEKELKRNLYAEIKDNQIEICKLKIEMNKTRLQFLVDRCDALEAVNKVAFHEKMADYHKGKIDYQIVESDLKDARMEIRRLYDEAYEWFGTSAGKSRIAKKERSDKSLRWRQENTPDKWRTPNKIRVSKQPKEDNNE
jgi:Ca2+-dependent lipid-binding protein